MRRQTLRDARCAAAATGGRHPSHRLRSARSCANHPVQADQRSPTAVRAHNTHILLQRVSHALTRHARSDSTLCSGLAWLYVGLLRLHLLVPSTPVDPTLKYRLVLLLASSPCANVLD